MKEPKNCVAISQMQEKKGIKDGIKQKLKKAIRWFWIFLRQ